MNRLNTSARTTEVDDVSDRLLVLFRKETALQEEAFLKSTFAEIETLSEQITEAIKRDVSLSKLEDADLRRDNSVRSLSNALVGYRSLPVASLRDNADKLYAVFSKYGVKITKENYATESSLIEALLKDLSAPELKTAIESLSGVGEIIAQLRNEQTAFTELRKILKNQYKVVAKVKAITFIGNTAQIRFEKRMIPVTGDLSKEIPVQNMIATVGYEYASQPMSEEARRINPLGFQVNSYRVDPETAP